MNHKLVSADIMMACTCSSTISSWMHSTLVHPSLERSFKP